MVLHISCIVHYFKAPNAWPDETTNLWCYLVRQYDFLFQITNPIYDFNCFSGVDAHIIDVNVWKLWSCF